MWAADGVRLAFDWTDLEPPERPGDYSTCRDKIVVYDGILAFHFNFEVVPWFFFFFLISPCRGCSVSHLESWIFCISQQAN